MLRTEGTTLLRQLRRIIATQCPGQLDDDELLHRFIEGRDQPSFAALVRRHGPMVLSVSCNVLHHHQDAEDVFQATFLLLARKAGTIRRRQSLGSWLHGIARRLALKTLAAKNRRQARERSVVPNQDAPKQDEVIAREMRALIHEELDRLPEKFRAPLLLCYWEGKTRDEAAVCLGTTADSVKKRLEKARYILGARLTRRGVAPTAAFFTWLICDTGGRAAVADGLIQSTAQAAVAFAVGDHAAGASTAAVVLAQRTIQSMMLGRWFSTVLIALAAIGIGAALGAVGYPSLAGKPSDIGNPALVQDDVNYHVATLKADTQRLFGSWRYTKGFVDGKNVLDGPFLADAWLAFDKDGTMTMDYFNQPKRGPYQLGKPGEIDTVFGVCLYKFDGEDRLSICVRVGSDADRRPTEFSGAAGTGQLVMSLERGKPGEYKPKVEKAAKDRPEP